MDDDITKNPLQPEQTGLNVGPVSHITDSEINIAGRDILTRPTAARERRELQAWQREHLDEAVKAYVATQARLRQELADPPRPEAPYKGLNYFDPLDKAIFFGREAVAEALAERLLRPQSRLTVLHAPSGAGKTSLIRAGLIPRLLAAGCHTLWTRPLPYPQNIYEPISRACPQGPDYADLPLRDFFSLVTERLPEAKPLVVFLDQFERLFGSEGETALPDMERDLGECVAADEASLPLRLVIGIRSDFLWALDRLRGSLPGILDQRLLLQPLTRQQALQAITCPVAGWTVGWEPQAAQAVLAYLAKGEIEPPHLQLICAQLYEQAEKAGRERITCEDVKEHDLAALHREYLRNELAGLPDEEMGWQVLKQLVTAVGVARPRPLSELNTALGTAAGAVIETLVDRRVLRQEKGRAEPQVEIAHETLAQVILERESPQEIRRKAARELIQRGLDDWLGHASKPLLGPDRLRILDEYHDVLQLPLLGDGSRPERERQALEFLLRSALAAGQSVELWYRLAQQGGVDAAALLQERLESQNFRERTAVVQALGGLGTEFIPALCERLADDYPQVRSAAIAALERLQPSGEWREHLKYECYVPAGEFVMGEDKEAHKIHLDAFYIARYPVTNTEYQRYRADIGQPFDLPAGKEQHPVVEVTWYDARDYAAWAGMRLLTEAEWEKAARWEPVVSHQLSVISRVVSAVRGQSLASSGKKRKYPWGDGFDKTKCNTSQSGIGDTTPVGKYSPQGDSPYGCADMAGNIWEWISSVKEKYPYQAEDGREELTGARSRVLRGGSFGNVASAARCASRYDGSPFGRWSFVGFRVGVGVGT